MKASDYIYKGSPFLMEPDVLTAQKILINISAGNHPASAISFCMQDVCTEQCKLIFSEFPWIKDSFPIKFEELQYYRLGVLIPPHLILGADATHKIGIKQAISSISAPIPDPLYMRVNAY